MSNQSPIINFSIRSFQAIFAITTLALSANLVRDQYKDSSAPVVLKYATFTGAVTLIASLVGAAMQWVDMLQGKVILLVDGIIAVGNLAGGILLAAGIGLSKCGDTSDENRVLLKSNILFNGGCDEDGDYYNWAYLERREVLELAVQGMSG
ncbi:hypothetical protein CC80DRAFT_15112 [Byssothecium circinans]|uniref:MARVEL domain-containing protein n=1 Tax=Byssothecium circinans TaxID=147558 RepID=A0A6A5U3Q9_9PLEO|nr:hypothetical protein CC80DRAFT_15112 [Byssothecium circinans]